MEATTRAKSHETIDRVAEKAHEAVDTASKIAGNAEDRMRGTAGQARERSQDLLQNVTDYVHDNPMTALGLAFAAGTIFSALTRRR